MYDLRRLTALTAGLLLSLSACAPSDQPASSGGSSAGQPASSSGEVTSPEEAEGAASINYLCGVDSFGRSFMPVSGMEEERDVGLFFFLWHGESSRSTHDVTKLLAGNPDALWNTQGTPESPVADFHYWGEPLFGYYASTDPWVARRHVEMLTSAGVDFLLCDATNAYTYDAAWKVLLEALDEYQKAGWDVPQIAFYTNTKSIATMDHLWKVLYAENLYPDLWYSPQGKPMIVGIPDALTDVQEANDPSYIPKLPDSLIEKLDIRWSQWPNKPYREDGYPWMEWTYPQPIHSGVMNVSIAQHPQLPFSDSWFDRSLNRGRGYDVATGINDAAQSRLGLNFQSQWDTAIKEKEKLNTVFITGWNEWVAQKLIINGKIYFVDCFNEEFSRDAEPMKGGYGDAFYLQMMDNIRRFKGLKEGFAAPVSRAIDIEGDFSQWDEVTNTYKAVSQSVSARNETSVDGTILYQTPAPRNNIQQIKVTHDEENLYFLISCEKEITGEGADWMNLLLGVGEPRLEGWEGYQYVVNREKGIVSRLDEKGNLTAAGEARLCQRGSQLAVEVPLSALGTDAGALGVYFKVADGVEKLEDIMDYYVTGKSVPMGRLSYFYYFHEVKAEG